VVWENPLKLINSGAAVSNNDLEPMKDILYGKTTVLS